MAIVLFSVFASGFLKDFEHLLSIPLFFFVKFVLSANFELTFFAFVLLQNFEEFLERVCGIFSLNLKISAFFG